MSHQDSHDLGLPSGLRYMHASAVDNRAGAGGDRESYPHSQITATGLYGVGNGFASYGQTGRGADNDQGAVDWSRSNRQTTSSSASNQPISPFDHHHTTPPSQTPPMSSPPAPDGDLGIFRQFHMSPQHPQQTPVAQSQKYSTLWWGDLEPWMDEEYAKQVCKMLGWEPVSIKVPHVASEGAPANNPGYCFLTFASQAQAASILASVHGPNSNLTTMPNSSKPFCLNWATSMPNSSLSSSLPNNMPSTTPQHQHQHSQHPHQPIGGQSQPPQQYTKEYSIFVGDLAPETSNSDLVAVFRNPVLGLRNDREPKFIRPFTSCKSAKIMLDPVTGVSRGYGFVRFTDETDQQRALIEMHGLYCLSRPMRISPATAKFKASQPNDPPMTSPPAMSRPQPSFGIPFVPPQPQSVSAPIAAPSSFASLNGSVPSSVSGSSLPSSSNSFQSAGTSNTSTSSDHGPPYNFASSDDMLNLPNNVLAQIAQQYATSGAGTYKPLPSVTSITSQYVQDSTRGPGGPNADPSAPRYMISEESWKHHAQARAILGNLIGPNGEQLTSTDPYNTTVFVGGLSPLISEETLRTFFAPFGDIHYVKVPVGKHCGFVQFVRKADAERAIEKMQGFPIGGSRIRLSWGRSQYKAAQAAAQAAQSAALQNHHAVNTSASAPPTVPPPPSNPQQPTGQLPPVTPEQLVQLVQSMAAQGLIDPQALLRPTAGSASFAGGSFYNDDKHRGAMLSYREEGPLPFEANHATYGHLSALSQEHSSLESSSSFSPFSPVPNIAFATAENKRRETAPMIPHPPSGYPYMTTSPQSAQPAQSRSRSPQEVSVLGGNNVNNHRVSPSHARPSSTPRYGPFLEGSIPGFPINKAPGRPEPPISRPSSGQPSAGRGSDVENQEHDIIQDLNGTLASLNLTEGTNAREQWKSSEEGPEESMQFNMPLNKSSTPSQ